MEDADLIKVSDHIVNNSIYERTRLVKPEAEEEKDE